MAGGLYFDADPNLSTNTCPPANLTGNLDTESGSGLSSASGPGSGTNFITGSGNANGDKQRGMGVSVTDALDAFEAEDEALTRVMAGLL